MKILFDSEDFFTTRKIAWFLFWVATVVIVFHMGMWCAMHQQFHHGQVRGGYGQQYFNQQVSGGGWQMPTNAGQDAFYYQTQ